MNTLRVGLVLLLGLFTAGMCGLTLAADRRGGYSGQGGHGGYSGQGGHGGYIRGGHGGYIRGGHGGYIRGGHGNVGVGVVVNPFWFTPGYYSSPYYYPRAYYAPYYYPSYYYSPYYYPPSVVTVPTEPPVYIERGEDAGPAPQASASWYYCADPQGYYPYVEQCPGGWQAVPPRSPASPDEGR